MRRYCSGCDKVYPGDTLAEYFLGVRLRYCPKCGEKTEIPTNA